MAAKKKAMNVEALEDPANVLKAIAHPMRLAVVKILKEGGKKTVTEIYETLGIEQAVASHHLGLLKNKGVLKSKRDGKNIHYFLKDEKLGDILALVNVK